MAIKFQTNKPIKIVFPYGDFLEVSGQYGAQFLYTVEVEGVRDRLYTTPKLHQYLQEEEVGPGSELTITKIEGEGNRMDWKVEASTPESNGQPNGEVVVLPSDTGNGHSKPTWPNFEGMDRLMDCCLKSSWDAWNGLDEEASFSSEDVRAVGITLFLECARKGIAPLSMEEALSI